MGGLLIFLNLLEMGAGAVDSSVGIAIGTSVSNVTSKSISIGTSLLNGTSTATGNSKNNYLSTGIALGISSTNGISNSIDLSIGSTFGISTSNGISKSISVGTGIALGTSNSNYILNTIFSSEFNLLGISTVTGLGSILNKSTFICIGNSSSNVIGSTDILSNGIVLGTSSANGFFTGQLYGPILNVIGIINTTFNLQGSIVGVTQPSNIAFTAFENVNIQTTMNVNTNISNWTIICNIRDQSGHLITQLTNPMIINTSPGQWNFTLNSTMTGVTLGVNTFLYDQWNITPGEETQVVAGQIQIVGSEWGG